MLPDYIRTKETIKEILMKEMSRRARKYQGVLAFDEYRIFEGRELVTVMEDGKKIGSQTQEIGGKVEFKTDDIITGDPSHVFELLDKLAQQMSTEQMKMAFQELGRVCDETGQTIDHKGQVFNADIFLKGIERVWVDFDENGKMRLPSFVVGDQMAKKVKEVMEAAEKDPEFRKKYEELVEKKWEEWRAREASRKLVG